MACNGGTEKVGAIRGVKSEAEEAAEMSWSTTNRCECDQAGAKNAQIKVTEIKTAQLVAMSADKQPNEHAFSDAR